MENKVEMRLLDLKNLEAVSRVWSWTARTLGSWVRIPLEEWMRYMLVFLCCALLCR